MMPGHLTAFEQAVYDAVRRIPRGRVATYAAVARAIGKPRSARAVGNALNHNPYQRVPCHRVVRSDGHIGGFARGTTEKVHILMREGVRVADGRVAASCILYRLNA